MRPVERDTVRVRLRTEVLARPVPLQREELAIARKIGVVEQVDAEARQELATVEVRARRQVRVIRVADQQVPAAVCRK